MDKKEKKEKKQHSSSPALEPSIPKSNNSLKALAALARGDSAKEGPAASAPASISEGPSIISNNKKPEKAEKAEKKTKKRRREAEAEADSKPDANTSPSSPQPQASSENNDKDKENKPTSKKKKKKKKKLKKQSPVPVPAPPLALEPLEALEALQIPTATDRQEGPTAEEHAEEDAKERMMMKQLAVEFGDDIDALRAAADFAASPANALVVLVDALRTFGLARVR